MQNVSTVFGKQKLSKGNAIRLCLPRGFEYEIPTLTIDLINPPLPVPSNVNILD